MDAFENFLTSLETDANRNDIDTIRTGYMAMCEATNDVKSVMPGLQIADEVRGYIKRMANSREILEVFRNPSAILSEPLSNGITLAVTGTFPGHETAMGGYDHEENAMWICMIPLLQTIGYHIKGNTPEPLIIAIVNDFLDNHYDSASSVFGYSLGSTVVHEMRHYQDEHDHPIMRSDAVELGNEQADYDELSRTGNLTNPKSRNYRTIEANIKKITDDIKLLPNMEDIEKNIIDSQFKHYYRILFGANPYRSMGIKGICKKLDYIRKNISPEQWRDFLRVNYIKGAGGDVSELPRQMTDNEKALEWTAELYAMRVYMNSMTEVNAHIAQYVPSIAMLRKTNEDHFDVSAEVYSYLFNIGNMIGLSLKRGAKMENETKDAYEARIANVIKVQRMFAKEVKKRIMKRLYTLLSAANRIEIDDSDTLDTRLQKMADLMESDKK